MLAHAGVCALGGTGALQANTALQYNTDDVEPTQSTRANYSGFMICTLHCAE